MSSLSITLDGSGDLLAKLERLASERGAGAVASAERTSSSRARVAKPRSAS